MNAETAKQHLSREPDQQPDLTDMPVSGRSEPRPAPVTGPCRIWLEPQPLTRRFHAWCENHTPWMSWTFDPPLHDGQIAELARQHSQPITVPSSPVEACFACGAPNQVFIGVAEVLPDGSTGTVHLYCRDITPCNDRRDAQLLSWGSASGAAAPFGTETDPS